jgi:hypothetical protein
MTLVSCDGEALLGEPLTLESGSAGRTNVCLPAGVPGLVVQVGGGAYPAEISWRVTMPSGAFLEERGAGSFVMGCAATPTPTATPAPTPLCAVAALLLADSFGDGWNGNALSLRSCEGVGGGGASASAFASGLTLRDGAASGRFDVCVPLDYGNAVVVEVGGGAWASETSWSLTLPATAGGGERGASGAVVLEGSGAGTWTEGCGFTAGPSASPAPSAACVDYTITLFDSYGCVDTDRFVHVPVITLCLVHTVLRAWEQSAVLTDSADTVLSKNFVRKRKRTHSSGPTKLRRFLDPLGHTAYCHRKVSFCFSDPCPLH